ncbi:MAG: S9 family peptidase [Bryobacterales bacterium]|nr:S9 family peptidase [Bryobacterales bacterium]
MHIGKFVLPTVALSTIFAQPPATPKKPVTDTYHGTTVTDDYRWLENASDPAVKAWSDAQNRTARQYLDALPQRAKTYDELKKLFSQQSPRYSALEYRRGLLFAMKTQPPKEQPMLVTLKSADDPASERVIVDPNQIDAKGGTEIDFYVPSVDGRLVAVSMSKGGSESGDVYVYDVASGKQLAEVIPRVNGGTAGGSLAWNADASGFYYTRYPHTGERPAADLDFYQQVYFHKLGTKPEQDTYSLGKDFPRIAEIMLNTSEDGKYVLARMANGDGGDFAFYLHGPTGDWVQVTRLADQIPEAAFGLDGNLYLLSRQNAPMGKIIRVPLNRPALANAQTVVPEAEGAIKSVIPAATRLYVADQAGGPSDIRVFALNGAAQGTVPLQPISSVREVLRTKGDEILVNTATYLTPPAWFRFDGAADKLTPTALVEKGAADFSDCEVVREFATSKDGTKVPLNIIRRKGTKLDGNNPTVLYGYGGYGVNLEPSYNLALRPLLDRGIVYVYANLRGGGEYGEEWHRAGMLTKKQNVFDDFAAAAQWLIDHRYTNSSRFAIEGGSNGGLLMGAALTQHPDLFRAVVSHVWIYDMLRVELQPNGAFNVTEFGTVKEADQFRALYAYSPYHHVKEGVQYPAVLFLTGANDPRVDPSHSRKMTARLQASGTKRPVLLRTTDAAGHGIGTALSERIAQQADVTAFLFDQLGVK